MCPPALPPRCAGSCGQREMSSSLGVRSGIRPWESNADSPGSTNRSLHEACDDHAGRLHKLLDLNCQTGDGDGDGDDAALLLGTASRGCEEGAPVRSGLPQPSCAGVSPGGQLPRPRVLSPAAARRVGCYHASPPHSHTGTHTRPQRPRTPARHTTSGTTLTCAAPTGNPGSRGHVHTRTPSRRKRVGQTP